jgi:hypothetical protein
MFSRAILHDLLRSLSTNVPGDDEPIKRLRESLHADFSAHEGMSKNIAGIPANTLQRPGNPSPPSFDDLDDDDTSSDHPMSESQSQPADAFVYPGPLPIHLMPITLPSNLQLPAGHPYCVLEITLRKRRAASQLTALREIIADKSFQYSHVIRPSTSRFLQSRARSAVKNLNKKISFHCRIYMTCRSAMITLGADAETLETFKVLSKDDVKASTALLDPNSPGSSTIQLSWLWRTGPQLDQRSPAALQECM